MGVLAAALLAAAASRVESFVPPRCESWWWWLWSHPETLDMTLMCLSELESLLEEVSWKEEEEESEWTRTSDMADMPLVRVRTASALLSPPRLRELPPK